MALEDLLKKKPKYSRSKKVAKVEKKKLSITPEPHAPIQEVSLPEPEDAEEEVPLEQKKS